MEFVGPPRLFEAWDLLGVPGLGSMDVDDDEGEMIIGIRPKCSPLPRRKSSVTDEDSEPELPLSGSRRVSFADAKGLSLVQVKEFDTWDVPTLRGYESSDSEGKEAEEYFLSLHSFSLPLSPEELCIKVQDQKVELESINLLPGTTILKGVIRVLNISFSKAVYIRTTLDAWSSHFDLLAEYIPGSSDGVMDCFSFKLTLVPPFGEQGARVDFSLRYETPVGTFWANNNNKNYVMFCRQRSKGKPQKDNIKKSCLKSVSRSFLSMDMSAVAGSPQDDISAVESKHGEGVNDKKTKELSDAQSAMSGEDGQKLQIENRCNSNRRSRRKAARLARVRDYFAQRDEGTKDTDKDESPLEAKQEVQEEKPKEKHLSPERSSKSGCSQFVCESFGTCIKSLPDSTSVSVLEKSERNNLAWQLSNLESSTDSPDSPPHSDDEPAPAECHNVNKPDSIPGEENSKQGDEFTNSTADEPVDSIVSAVISKSLIGQTPSFTFGTIVAPLYHQMFDRVGSESQSVADRGNPAQVTLTTEDLSHHPHTETKESRCPTLTEAGNVNDNVRGNIVKLQESNQDGSDANPSSPKEEESGLSLESDNLNQTDTLQDPGAIIQSDQSCTNTLSGSAEVYSHIVDIMHADLLRAKISTQRHQGDTQEHNKTCDHQHKITAETAQAQMTAGIHSQSKGQEVMTSPEASGRKISDEVNQLSSDSGENDKMEDNSGEIIKTKSTATASSEADNSLEALQDLELTEINHSATKETTGCFHSISHCEIIGRNDYTTPEASLENQECRNVKEQTKLTNNSYECETKHSAESVGGGEAAESLIKEVMGNNRTPDDMFAELKDEYTSEDEPIIVSGEVETALLNEEEISSADNTEVKNWEMMVEEEEENMLTGQGEGKTISLKGELLTAAGENRTKPEGVAGVEDKEKGREEESQGIVVGKYGGNVEEEFKNETAAEEDAAEKMEAEEKREEKGQTDKEKHFAEIQEVSIKRTNVQEEEMNGEEETEIDSNQGDEACMVWRDQEKPPRVNTEEENPNCKKEVLVEARDSEMVTADPERMTREDREDDTAQNHAEDLLSAPVSTEEKSATDKQRKGGIVPLSPEMHLYKEEDLQKSLTASHYRPRAENESCAVHILTDEPESAQTSHDMAESDSDEEEVELYMHCLRAVHAGSQASKDRDMGFSVGKRPSVSRSKLLSTPMPSISESLDEEQQLSCQHPDVDTTYLQPTAAALPLSSGQERIRRNVSQWRKTFSCSNILKILLYTTLLVIFLVVAYHYDFLVCFVVYLISLFWLCFQGEAPPVKNNNRIN